jgi:photosystem II stability/assembly factor-like uncharacterized protein
MQRLTPITALLLFFFLPLLNAQEWVRQNPYEDIRNAKDVEVTSSGFGIVVGDDDLAMRTTDFGNTWEVLNTGLDEAFMKVAILEDSPSDRTLILAGKDISISTDDGASWTVYNPPLGIAEYLSVPDEETLYVANNTTLAKSSDGGDTWQEITVDGLEFFTEIFFHDAEIGWVGDREGNIYLTSDGGMTWTQVNIKDESGNQNVVMHFLDENVGFAAVFRDWYKTEDGGQTWDLLETNVFPNAVSEVALIDENTPIVASSTDRIYRSDDGGSNWIGSGPTNYDIFYEGISVLADGSIWTVGSYRTVAYSTNAGLSYVDQTPAAKSTLNDILFSDLDNGWAVGRNGTILQTQNKGETWTLVDPGPDYEGDTWLDLHILDDGTVWVAGQFGIIETNDQGATWNSVFFHPFDFQEFAQTSNALFACSDDGKVYRTSDQGTTWDTLQTNNFNSLLGISFFDDLTGFTSGRQGTILKTTDGGDSWEPLNFPGPGNVFTVQFLTEDHGFAVTSDLFDNIWETTDGGETWTSFSTPDNTYWRGLYFINDTLGYLTGGSSAFGRLYRTTDAGATWESYYNTETRVNGISYQTDGTDWGLWICGEGGNIERQGEFTPNTRSQQPTTTPFTVYPNPSSGRVQLDLPESLSENAQLRIYDQQGSLVRQLSPLQEVDLTGMPMGTYYLQVIDGPRIFLSKLLLIL